MAEIIYDKDEPVGRRFKIKILAYGSTLTFNLGDVEYTTGFQTNIEKLGFEYWKFLQEQPKEKKDTVDNIEDLAERIQCARKLYLSKEHQQRLEKFEKLAQRTDLGEELSKKVKLNLREMRSRDKLRCFFENHHLYSLHSTLLSENTFQYNLEKIMKEIEK